MGDKEGGVIIRIHHIICPGLSYLSGKRTLTTVLISLLSRQQER